jgi:hypothetical protein
MIGLRLVAVQQGERRRKKKKKQGKSQAWAANQNKWK